VARTLLADLRLRARELDKHPWRKAPLILDPTVRELVGGIAFFMNHRCVPRAERLVNLCAIHYRQEARDVNDFAIINESFKCLRAMNHTIERFGPKEEGEGKARSTSLIPMDSLIHDMRSSSLHEAVEDANMVVRELGEAGYAVEDIQVEYADEDEEGDWHEIDTSECKGCTKMAKCVRNHLKAGDLDAVASCSLQAVNERPEVIKGKLAKNMVRGLIENEQPACAMSVLAEWRTNIGEKEMDLDRKSFENLAEQVAVIPGAVWLVMILYHESPLGDHLWFLGWSNLLIEACASSRELELGLEIFDLISEQHSPYGVQPDERTLLAVARLCRSMTLGRTLTKDQEQLVQSAVHRVMEMSMSQDMHLPAEFYNLVMGTSMDYETCREIYRDMQTYGVSPNLATMEVLVESALRTGELPLVVQAMKDGERLGMSVDVQPILESLRAEWDVVDLVARMLEEDDEHAPDASS